MLASQWRRKGRDMSITASQSGKTSIGGAAGSARRTRTVSSIAEVKSNAAPLFRRAVIGRNVEDSGVPTSRVQREIYPTNVWGGQCSKGQKMIRVGCDRVGVEVRGGGSSAGSYRPC